MALLKKALPFSTNHIEHKNKLYMTRVIPKPSSSGQSYKQFTLIIYDSRVVIWGIFKSGTTLES